MELVVIIIAIAAIAIFSNKKPSEGVVNDSRQYDLGYWAGRRDLRREIMQEIEGAKSLDESTIQKVIDRNQWYPEDSKEQAVDIDDLAHSNSDYSANAETITVPEKKIEPVDYSVGLLYLGAFLFIAAASLFVLLSGVSGVVKTLVVIVVGLLFYASGYVLSKKSKRLVSVGSTFAAMGLMVTPLAGVAAYGYWFNQTHGTAIWLTTSLTCAVLYAHALYKLRSEYIGYLFVGVLVSLVESGFSQFGLSSYYLAWGLMLVAVTSLLATHLLKNKRLGSVVDMPFTISAIVLVPTATLWSLALIIDHGVTQLILTLYFAAIYYLLYGWLLGSGLARQVCWLTTQVAFLIAGGVWVYTFTDSRIALSMYLAGYFVAYSVVSLIKPIREYIPNHHQGILGLSSLLMLSTIISMAEWSVPVFAVVCVGSVIAWLQWEKTRQIYCAILGQALLLTVPGVLGWYVLGFRIEPVWVSALYVILALALASVEYLRRSLNTNIQYIIEVGYALASFVALYIALANNGYAVAAVSCATALIAYHWAKQRNSGYASAIGHILLYGAIFAAYLEAAFEPYLLGLAWLVLGMLLYAFQSIVEDERWRASLRYTAMFGLLMTSCIGVAYVDFWYFGPFAFGLLSAAIFYEAVIQKGYILREAAAAVSMVAVQWVLTHYGVDEFLIYSHLWATLLLVLGLLRLQRGEKSLFEAYLWLSLITATLPFAFMLLGGADLKYGWLFIAEHISMTLVGVVAKKSSVVWWGLVATVLAVLYQLRDLQFVALGVLSIFVLSVAIYLALKHQKAIE